MPRFCATAAMPAVRQLASPTSRYSIGVMPWSSDAKISGWSASNVVSVLCDCSSPRPKKFLTVAWLWVPFSHLQDARQVNFVASGAPLSASRASSSAWTLTPLSARRHCHGEPLSGVIEVCRKPGIHTTPGTPAAERTGDIIARMATSAPKTAAGSVGHGRNAVTSTCRSRCGSTAGATLHPIRVAYETYGTLSPARDNVILVCHALSGDAHAAGFAKTPPAESTRDGFGAEDRDGTARQGARLVGRHDRPRQGVRHRSLLRRLHQPARRLPRDDRAVVDRPGDRQAVRVGLPRHHRRRHGAHGARLPRRARHRAARGRRGRIARRHAGVRVGDPLPRSGRRDRRDRQHPRDPAAGRRVERDRAQRDHGRPGLAGRPLLRHRTPARRRHGRRADGRPHHLPVGARRSATSSAGGCSSPTTSATR